MGNERVSIDPMEIGGSVPETETVRRSLVITKIDSLRSDRGPLRPQNIFLNLAGRSFG
jgi:hypothetical protein